MVLRRVGRAPFAVLVALRTATAAAVGLGAPARVPGLAEGTGIVAVAGAVALRSPDGESAAGGRPWPR